MKEVICRIKGRNIAAVAYRDSNNKLRYELCHEFVHGDITLSAGFESLQECSLAAYAAWGLRVDVEFRFVKLIGIVFDENEKKVADMVRVIAVRFGDHWKMYLFSRSGGLWPAAALSDQPSLPSCRAAAFAQYRTFSVQI
jgi:hypothetical protein